MPTRMRQKQRTLQEYSKLSKQNICISSTTKKYCAHGDPGPEEEYTDVVVANSDKHTITKHRP